MPQGQCKQRDKAKITQSYTRHVMPVCMSPILPTIVQIMSSCVDGCLLGIWSAFSYGRVHLWLIFLFDMSPCICNVIDKLEYNVISFSNLLPSVSQHLPGNPTHSTGICKLSHHVLASPSQHEERSKRLLREDIESFVGGRSRADSLWSH
jgi:hypothetical protein